MEEKKNTNKASVKTSPLISLPRIFDGFLVQTWNPGAEDLRKFARTIRSLWWFQFISLISWHFHFLINKHYILYVHGVFIWLYDYIIVDTFFTYNIRYIIDLLTVTFLKNSITKSQFLNFEIPVQDLGKYNHTENGGPLGMVPLITPYTPYIDLHSRYLLGISPFQVTMYNHPGVAAFSLWYKYLFNCLLPFSRVAHV